MSGFLDRLRGRQRRGAERAQTHEGGMHRRSGGQAPALQDAPGPARSEGGDAAPVVLEARGITKRFPGVLANDAVDFAVRAGEVHALVGENGAGKTTLMNVCYGLEAPDAGTLLVDLNNQQLVDGTWWYQVRTPDGTVGWVSGEFLAV